VDIEPEPVRPAGTVGEWRAKAKRRATKVKPSGASSALRILLIRFAALLAR